jgi:hypothetical protein
VTPPKRRSLRDREAAALVNHGQPTATPPEAPPRRRSAAPARTGDVIRLGTYWRLSTFQGAKSAYLADLDQLRDAPDSFARWVDRAIRRHADLTPEKRGSLVRKLPAETGDAASRSFHVPSSTVDAMEAAIVDDRRGGRVLSRTEFVSEAVRAATAEARKRYGQDLPPAPARLPNKPPRSTH